MEKKSNNKRTRNWTFILYPESAILNWKSVLKEYQIPFVISPLHDKDINEATGELKKAHYHIVLLFDSVKAYNQVLEITEKLKATIPQVVNSYSGIIRYLIHIDYPEKYQYDIKDIETFGDIDITSPFQNSTTRYIAIKEMIEFIEANGITEFSDLFLYSSTENEVWFRYLCDSCAYVINQHIKSFRHKHQKNKES